MKETNPVNHVILFGINKILRLNRVFMSGLFITLLFISEVFSQPYIAFNHLTVEDGLSQSSVTCILQDSKGFMWFGTQDGLNRYDGYSFKIFKNDPSDSTSLSNNFIFSIYQNQSDQFFIETQGGTLHLYNPRSESFLIVIKDSVNLENARISTVGALLRESSGLEWTGGLGNETGLKRTDTKTGQSTIFKHNPDDPFSLSDDKVYSVFRDRSGNLWIGTFNGLDRLDEQTGKFYHYKNNPNDTKSLADNWVWPIYEDSRGNLWIGTVRGGLCRFDTGSNTFINYKNDPNDPATINDNFIFSIYEDRTGLIWIGTNLGGISYFNPLTQPFELYRHDPENTNSLSDDIILSMLVDRKGDYWIGTRNGGLNRLEYNRKTFTRYYPSTSTPNSLISNSIQSLLEDRSGVIWIGSYSSGLDSYNPKTGTFTHYLHDPADPGTITDNRIYSIAEARDGNIWIGTYAGGLNKIDRKSGKISNYQFEENDSTSISSNATWSMAFDGSDNLWIGTFGGGVNLFNQKSQTFSHLNHNPDDSTSISDNYIIRVFKDSKDNLWFGTTKGLSRYLKDSNIFKNYTEKDGLANSFVYGIVEDDKGNLWISTNDGLSKFNPANETFKNYYYIHGLQGNEFNQNAFAKDENTGNLLFGGLNGFNVFHPDSLKDNIIPPPIAFTGYMRYNTDESEGKPIVEKGISYRDSIFLTYKDNIITIEFAALTFYNNTENQFKYKLEGFTDNWIELGHNRSVVFANLSPGDYSLKVIGSNSDGVWNEEGTSLMIFVSPPWWRTNIAYGFYFIAIFNLLFGVRRVEIKRREQKAQIRESALQIKATEAEKRALEIENERKTKELEEARQLQLSMLPKELPDLPDLEIAAFMRTATEVGGDYYDFIVQEDGVLNVAFGDATGHGLQAGTMVTLMKGFFTSDSTKFGLKEFMGHCTKVIKDIKLGRILMSFSYLKIDKKKLQITSAGMPPIYYHHKKTNQLEEIIIEGMPLDAMKMAKYETTEKTLNSGDTILLLTDGLPEQMNGKNEMFDYPRVKKHFSDIINNSPNTIIEKLVNAGDKWMNGSTQEDDITFVVIRIK
jgi:ligand-binding sensor domain-containing protein/serine phosphatase RsbU (regulator of sigma subunit)